MNDPKPTDDISFEDSEQYRAEQSSFKETVLRQYRKCMEEGSKDMVEDGVVRRVIGGQLIEEPAPDQITVFLNSIEMLKISLLPEIKKNEKIVEPFFNGFEEEMEAISKTRSDKLTKINQHYQNLMDMNPYRKIDVTLMNSQKKEIWDNYERMKIHLYKNKLLVGMSFLLNHLNYFEERGAYG